MSEKNNVAKGFAWKLLERFGVQGIQFVLQIVLARLLSPEHYGTLSLMLVFTALANVFIQTGFNTALIQKKDVVDEDYSSVFWVSLFIATILYGVIFISAPFIGSFYKMKELVAPLRVLALVLFPGVLNSIQLAKVGREMDFKQVFKSNIGAIIISGVLGIAIALMGGGLWALVVQTLANTTVATIVMLYTVRWYPKKVCELGRVKVLFKFGWKILVSGLLETLYQDIQSLIIGKKYTSGVLGYYNRGKQFPQFVINAINGAIQSVMLPAMSAMQDHKNKIKAIMRESITLSAYIIFPMMAGLAAVASTLIEILLTDVWLPSVPYMQINCLAFAFYPVSSCNLQAINALGRSDIFLKLEVIKKTIGMVCLVIAVVFFESPLAIAVTGTISIIISTFVNAFPNKKLVNYSYNEQIMDIMPSAILSMIMFAIVSMLENVGNNLLVRLVVQIVIGFAIYIALSIIFRLRPYKVLIDRIKQVIKNK